MVHADLEIDGIVEKPDVVGAIFGQTEGLLGEELDLRELQKSGRIGRIEVRIQTKDGKSVGEIVLPSSLDKVETSILAAALETVDRVGPCEAKIRVKSIEDTRTIKREHVVDRAKDILKGMIGDILPERKEISEIVRGKARTADVESYGFEKLAAGPDLDDSEEMIVVEGRADVINLLKHDIRNVIALQGKIIPKTVVDLSKNKTVTAFVDGDRGGDLIVRQLAENANINFVTKAPDGKEVEELTKKEIVKCLRNKIPFDQFMYKIEHPRQGYVEARKSVEGESFYLEKLKELEGTLRGTLLDRDGKVVAEADVKDISDEMEKREGIKTVVFDGIITQRLVDVADKNNIKNLVGVRKTRIQYQRNVNIYTT